MLKKPFVALCLITLSFMAQANALTENDVQHDPTQCPVGIDGYYLVSANSDINFKVSRDLNNNLVLQYVIGGALVGQPRIAHGRYVPVKTVRTDGTQYVIGQLVSYCKGSAVYSAFISNDESEFESNVSKMTLVTGGLEVQQVAPTVANPQVWPRVD